MNDDFFNIADTTVEAVKALQHNFVDNVLLKMTELEDEKKEAIESLLTDKEILREQYEEACGEIDAKLKRLGHFPEEEPKKRPGRPPGKKKKKPAKADAALASDPITGNV